MLGMLDQNTLQRT